MGIFRNYHRKQNLDNPLDRRGCAPDPDVGCPRRSVCRLLSSKPQQSSNKSPKPPESSGQIPKARKPIADSKVCAQVQLEFPFQEPWTSGR
jgi:hypothetical protein